MDQNDLKILNQAFKFDLKDVFAKIDHLIQPPKSNDSLFDFENSKMPHQLEESGNQIDQSQHSEPAQVESTNESENLTKNE